MLLLYKSLFLPYLNYCVLVWGTTISSNIQKLCRLQRKAIRIITHSPFDFPVQTLFETFKILSVEHLYNYYLCQALIKDTRQNNFLKILSQLNRNTPTKYNTRNPEHWTVHAYRTNYALQTIKHRIPTLLNNYLKQNIDIFQLNTRKLRNMFLTYDSP